MADKREKFVKLAEKRVTRTIRDIRMIGNLSNRAAYAYEERDIQKIFNALSKELETARKRFSSEPAPRDEEFRLE